MKMEKNNDFIITYNENGYKPVDARISFDQKLRATSQNIRATYGRPVIIMLQEILAGRNMKFLNLVRTLYSEYELILPAGFDYVTHWKSIMSVILVRRDALGSYKVIELDSELPNRTCCILAELNGRESFIVNSHIVQTQNFRGQANWYIAERRRLHEQQWDFLHDALRKYKDANVIFAGDLQERRSAKNINLLKEEGYIVSGASGAKTVRNNFFNEESSIDHIVVNPSARASLGKDTEIIYDNSGVGKYSDHTLLCLCSL